MVGLVDDGTRFMTAFFCEPEFIPLLPPAAAAVIDEEGMTEVVVVPLPPTVPMPAKSAFGYFFAVLLELLKAKFWTDTWAFYCSFCDDAMRKEP